MGGSSGGQVTGYRYFANFLLFIGNPIEDLLGINFDKRGWVIGERIDSGNNGKLIAIKEQNLYGENEGGVYGVINLHTGTNAQLPDVEYSQYMESIGLKASAYPYQSYLSFSGSGKVDTGNGWIDGVFNVLAGYMNDAFYVGNSGYMKEMLLWPRRIHVRNNGDEQWYPLKAPIRNINSGIISYIVSNEYTVSVESKSYADSEVKDSGSRVYSKSEFIGTGYVESGITNTGFVYRQYEPYVTPFPYSQIKSQVIVTPSTAGLFKITGRARADYGGGWNFDLKQQLSLVSFKYINLIQTPGTQTYPNSVNFDFEAVFSLVAGESAIITLTAERFYEEVLDKERLLYASLTNIRIQTPQDHSKTTNNEFTDINPIHKIREILTDDTAMGRPESSVNDINFIKAADRIFDEGLGISWSITEKSCLGAINELCYHIEAGIRVNRQTGLYEMVLFRDNWFAENEIHTIVESKIKSMQYEITNADEVINQVNVNYYDQKNIKNSSFSISENGLIQTLNRVNAETVDFPYFMNMRNAEIVANWKLKQLSTGAIKGSFTTGWREARKWDRYDLIRLPWSKRWTGTILVRIMSINLGSPTNNEVSIDFIEVVPSTGMMNTTIVIDDPIDTKPEAPKPCNTKIFELPYFEAAQAFGEREVNTELTDNPEAGYLCAIAEKPQNNSLNAALYTDSGNGFERAATVNYCETAYLDQAIDRMSSAFVVKNVGNLASVRIGSQIFINDEIMVYQSYDAETKVLTVKRGAFGIPQSHTSNSILYFADDFVAVDQTLYVDSEIVSAKVLTTTPSGVLALSDAATYEVEFNARAIRPYSPANVKINGEYWPAEILPGAELVLTWVDRNRLQQTGGSILGFFDAGVIIESGVTYKLIVYAIDASNVQTEFFNQNIGAVNTYTVDLSTAPASAVKFRIVLKSVRGTYESYQSFDYTLNASFTAPYNLVGVFTL